MATVGDQAAQLHGLPGGHAVAHRPSDREPHTPEVEQAVPTWRRSATWWTPSYSTVSPVIHRVPWAWPSQLRAKPITSPAMGRLSGGPWRQGGP